MLQRKKPLTRKKALRAKAPMRANKPARVQNNAMCDDAARKLWPLLAERAGPPFTQNERLGPYRADFVCLAARLVILIEGNDDPERSDWFTAQNWRVLSYGAEAVIHAPESVVDAVTDAFSLRIVRP